MNKEYRQLTKAEFKWISSFERVMKKAPETLFLFVGAGFTVYPRDENNKRYMSDTGGVDGNAPSVSIETNMDYDGGDW